MRASLRLHGIMMELAEEINHGRKPTLPLLQLLNEFEVEYLIVGGYAVMKYGEPRYTKDLDLWVHEFIMMGSASPEQVV